MDPVNRNIRRLAVAVAALGDQKHALVGRVTATRGHAKVTLSGCGQTIHVDFASDPNDFVGNLHRALEALEQKVRGSGQKALDALIAALEPQPQLVSGATEH